jgi:hypothetical protein
MLLTGISLLILRLFVLSLLLLLIFLYIVAKNYRKTNWGMYEYLEEKCVTIFATIIGCLIFLIENNFVWC